MESRLHIQHETLSRAKLADHPHLRHPNVAEVRSLIMCEIHIVQA